MKVLRGKLRLLIVVIFCVFMSLLFIYWLQHFFAHRKPQFVPNYSKVTLTKDSDYETIFLQTGLGRSAVDKLLTEGDFQTILDTQKLFFAPPKTECRQMLGWFTKEDRFMLDQGPILVDLRPGDILLTLSTHSLGWRHGHAGLVIDENRVLECGVWGQDSALMNIEGWNTYSNYVVLRVKDMTATGRDVASYAQEYLQGVPYHLSSGFIGPKAPQRDKPYFGLQCAYLVWYAWNQYGFDLDGDGGRLVTSGDLLFSGNVEIVQVYGMDPRIFLPLN